MTEEPEASGSWCPGACCARPLVTTKCIFRKKKKNKVAQGSLALPLPETLSNPFSEEGQALGKGLETIHRTGLRQDLVMCDLFISLRSRLTMSTMSQNGRNLSKRSTGEGRGGAARYAGPLSEVATKDKSRENSRE